LGTALPMNSALRLTHVPGTVGSKAVAIGVHWKMQIKRKTSDQITVAMLRIQAPILKLRRAKMRQYMIRMAILTRARLMR